MGAENNSTGTQLTPKKAVVRRLRGSSVSAEMPHGRKVARTNPWSREGV